MAGKGRLDVCDKDLGKCPSSSIFPTMFPFFTQTRTFHLAERQLLT